MAELDGKVAIVTGGGGRGGIGSAIVRKLAEDGAKVAVTDINLEAAQAGVNDLVSRGFIAQAFHQDVSKSEDAARVVQEVRESLGQIDILVNNAGVSAHLDFVDISDAEWRRVMSINLDGVFYTTRAVLRGMFERRCGRIINMASITGKQAFPRFAHYCSSKFAVVGLTQAVALEAAPYGVTANTVCPGIIETPLHDGLLDQIIRAAPGVDDADDAREWFKQYIPLGRPQTTDDIAEMVAFLASEKARNITGASFHVDGGAVPR